MDWSSLPLDVFLQIFSYQANDFLFLLAISGVCRVWRAHTAWISYLAIRWPAWQEEEFRNRKDRICGTHKPAPLHLCDCAHSSISMVIARLHKIWYFELCNFAPSVPIVQAEKLKESDWEKMVDSLYQLRFSAGVVGAEAFRNICKCSNLELLSISSFVDSKDCDFSVMKDFVSSGSEPLNYLRTLKLQCPALQEESLKNFLQLCPNLEEIQVSIYGSKNEEGFHFQAPDLVDFELKLCFFSWIKKITAPGLRKLEVVGGQLLLLEAADSLEEMVASPSHIEFAEPEAMKYFWRLTLTGNYWSTYQVRSACSTVPTTKRICLADDFGLSTSYNYEESEEGLVDCYQVFAIMFEGGGVDELELHYGFLRKMRFDQRQEDSMQSLPGIEFLILNLEVNPEKELNIPRFVDAVETLINGCGVEWIALSFGDEDQEDVNFHRGCFDKEFFAIVVQNILKFGNPGTRPQSPSEMEKETLDLYLGLSCSN